VTDGIAWQLPALTLYTKLLRKAALADQRSSNGNDSRERAIHALRLIRLYREGADDAQSTTDVVDAWGDALSELVSMAQWAGVDLEGVLRNRARELSDVIRLAENQSGE
jgi:hypothetical protein